MIKLDLLPPLEKKNLWLEQIQRWILFYASTILIIFLVFVGFLFGIWSFLIIQQNSLASNLKSIQSDSRGQALIEQRNAIEKTNQTLEKINRIQKNHKYYSWLLAALSDLIPEGVRLESISIGQDGQAVLYGFAPKRDQVIVIKENLEQSKLFDDIFSPLANLTRQEAVNFYFKFKLKSSVLVYE